MNFKRITVAMLIAWASVATAKGDDAKPVAASADERDPKEVATTAYQSTYERIVRECDVSDPAKQKELSGLLKSWDVDTQQITSTATVVDPNLSAKLEQLDKELTSARQTGNTQLATDLEQKRVILVDAMGGWHSDARKALSEMDAKYQEAVRNLVSEEKYDVLDDILATAQDTQKNRPRRGPVRSARALQAMVDRLGDLTSAQRARIDQAFLRHRDAQRSRETRTDASTAMQTLYDEVFSVLTDGQKTRIEQQLIGRQTPNAAPPAPPTPAAPPGTAPKPPAATGAGATPPAPAAGTKP